MNGYKTLLQEANDEYIVNKSRFIGSAAPVETPAPAAEAPKAPSEPTSKEPPKPAVVPETAPQTEQTVHHPVAVAHPAPHTPAKPRGGLMDLFEQFHRWLRPKR